MTCVRLRALVIDFLVGFLDSCSDGLWLELSMNLCNIIIQRQTITITIKDMVYIALHVWVYTFMGRCKKSPTVYLAPLRYTCSYRLKGRITRSVLECFST
jgi:hypothetical protein